MNLNGYLAVVRFTMDDIPILLTNNREDAYEALQEIDDNTMARIQGVLGTDAAMLVCGAIYQFVRGEPIRVEHSIDIPWLTRGNEGC